MSDTVIKIDHVFKEYRLGAIGGTTLRDDLQRLSAKIRGKEDPTAQIGSNVASKNERFLALNDVSFEVKQGEALGIIGHNGAGKSTLLKLLSRVTAPTKGTISYNGRIASMLEVGTGFHGELTGRENVYMNGAILGMKKVEIDRKMNDIIAFAEMEQFIDTPVKRYSSGMYVKLAFSVAAHLDSEIMIMDEVLAVGDMAFQKKCLEKMSNAALKEGKTILYVSHNMNTIRQLCNRVVVLEKGKVVFNGDVDKGIGIYFNQNESARTHYDYSAYKRSPNETRALKMNGIDVLKKTESVFIRGEKIEFVLHFEATTDVESIGYRLEVFNELGQIVGTTFLDKPITASKNQIVDLKLEMSTDNFAPGTYKAAALFFDKDKLGNQIGVDRVEPAIIFEIADNPDDNIVWSKQYWGDVRFDDIKTIK